MTDTLQALDAAIQAHITENYQDAGFVDAWVLVTSSQTIEEHTISAYRMITPEVQPHHVDAGLAAIGVRIVRDSWDAALEGEPDDEG